MSDLAADDSFASLLRDHRRRRGLTQAVLAERAGIGVRTLQDLEDGAHQPQQATVVRLVGALNLGSEERRAFERAGLPAPRARSSSAEQSERAGLVKRAAARSNLPIQVTSFVGRERELAEVKRLLGDTRLLTLTGTGGCGKTRLALQIAGDLLGDYPAGVWLVELAPLIDPRLVPQAVATALGIRERAGEALATTLVRALREQRILLVLDNCEHLLDATAQLAAALLRGGPSVRLLATSREALGITGEVRWRVPSLAVPSAPLAPGTDLLRYEAVRLFADRAAAVLPGFGVNSENARAVVEICRQLDGIPLALELAAARLPSIPIQEIAARLDRRFRLLRGGNRAAMPRQQTLVALVDWSYSLLEDTERRLFDRLAVFIGGFTVEAAEAICAGEGIAAGDILDLLARLVEKSLILADDEGPGARYRLLETLRQFAREKLAEGHDDRAVVDRHATYYLRHAEEIVQGFVASLWMPTPRPLEVELGNLRAAMRWAVEAGDVERALRLCGDLWPFWYQRGYPAEEGAWLAELRAAPTVKRTAGRGRALSTAGILAWHQSDVDAARALLAEARSIQRECGDRAGLVTSLTHAGQVETGQGAWTAARALLQEALPLAQALGQPIPLIRCLFFLSYAAYGEGDYALAAALQYEAIATLPPSAPHSAAPILNWLGHIATAQGNYALARAYYGDSVARRRLVDFPVGMAVTLSGCANLAAAQGQHVRAARLAGAAARLCEESGVPAIRGQEADIPERLELARAAIGSDAYDAAWAEGWAMTREQAIACALEEDDG